MPKTYSLYLDQMLKIEVTNALTDEGHNVMRVADVGQDRVDDYQILQTAINPQ
jgi:hypothetical protein